MERRKFIATVGSLAAGSAAAVGTGAFTSVTASRDVDVEVADDASAYLRLERAGGANSHYVTDDGNGGTLEIQLSSDNATSDGGEGVNLDAVTQIDKLFKIENQGPRKSRSPSTRPATTATSSSSTRPPATTTRSAAAPATASCSTPATASPSACRSIPKTRT